MISGKKRRVLRQPDEVVFAGIEERRSEYPVAVMGRVLGVSRSGYCAGRTRPPSVTAIRREELATQIRVVHAEMKARYGSPRRTVALQSRGVACSVNTVAKVMKRHGIRSKTVRRFVRTTDSNHRMPVAENVRDREFTATKIEYWVIPPEADAEFVAGMEEVLDTYAEPVNPAVPVVCMDEQPTQLLKETRTPIPATKDHPKRVDYEYERAGTASVFVFCEPKTGWRQVSVRDRRTKVDWVHEVAALLRTRYAKAERVILVCDNRNTHTRGASYEAFDPATARDLVKRVEFRYTPKHGSWLNVAECERSAMTRQCLAPRRFGTSEELRSETAHWATATNAKQRGVDWQFRTADARTKLKSLYPK